MKVRQTEDRGQIWSALNGRKLVLTGLDLEQRQFYMQNLVHRCHQKGIDLKISEELEEVTDQDLVLMFAEIKKEEQKEQTGGEALQMLMKQMKILTLKKPAAILLISDRRVYGTQFGQKKNLKENEVGYIAHTSKEGADVQYMRMAEHLACRLAREEELPIRVARQSLRKETENLEQMLDALISVLLYGADGEIYNLTESGKPWVFEGEESDSKVQDEQSPLYWIENTLDTEKLDTIMSGGR